MKRGLVIWLLVGQSALALIFRDDPSPAANTETAPTGAYAGSGWQHQLQYFLSHGTIISPKHFMTATHLGTSQDKVTQASFFNGVEDRIFAIKGTPVRIGGVTDMRVFEIWETFDDYALLYTKSNEVGKELVIHGRGVGRGAELSGMGWKWGANSTQKSRWGRNQIDGVITSNGLEFLYFGFDDLLGQDEVMATALDSGGGWFIKDGPVWKLAAVSYAVDSPFSNAEIPSDSVRFNGAFYEAGGLYTGSDENGWELIPTSGTSTNPGDIEFYRQTHTYGSRVSEFATEIQAVISPAIAWAAMTPEERFENWLGGFGIVTSTGVKDDADLDGLTNLEEYLSESHPGENEDAKSPMEIVFLPNGSHQFTLIETLDLEGRGMTSTIEMSSDLETWTEVRDLAESSNTRDNPNGIRTRVLTRMPLDPGPMYYRLKIIL